MYSNYILNFQESIKILNAHMKKVWKLIVCPSYLSIFCRCGGFRICIYSVNEKIINMKFSYEVMGLRRFLFIYSWCRWSVSGNCWVLREWLWVSYLTPFFFFLPHSFAGFFFCGSKKRIKDRRKETRILFNSNFILGFNDNSVVRTFSCTRRNSCVSQTRCWNMLEGFSVVKFEVYVSSSVQ